MPQLGLTLQEVIMDSLAAEVEQGNLVTRIHLSPREFATLCAGAGSGASRFCDIPVHSDFRLRPGEMRFAVVEGDDEEETAT